MFLLSGQSEVFNARDKSRNERHRERREVCPRQDRIGQDGMGWEVKGIKEACRQSKQA